MFERAITISGTKVTMIYDSEERYTERLRKERISDKKKDNNIVSALKFATTCLITSQSHNNKKLEMKHSTVLSMLANMRTYLRQTTARKPITATVALDQ
jgi:isopropylmalate/homocitrate/citramalate synthase